MLSENETLSLISCLFLYLILDISEGGGGGIYHVSPFECENKLQAQISIYVATGQLQGPTEIQFSLTV